MLNPSYMLKQIRRWVGERETTSPKLTGMENHLHSYDVNLLTIFKAVTYMKHSYTTMNLLMVWNVWHYIDEVRIDASDDDVPGDDEQINNEVSGHDKPDKHMEK